MRQTIVALAADDVAHLEASHRPPPPLRTLSSELMFRSSDDDGPWSLASLTVAPIVDAAVDGVFDLID